MDFYTRKFAYVWLRFSEFSVNMIVFFYSLFFKRKKVNAAIKIAAFWYCPPNQIGSNLRLGAWKGHFEKDNIIFDNFYINDFEESIRKIEKGNWTSKYFYFSKSLWRRLPQILKLHNYDVVWIDRCIIPYFPRKNAYIESRLKKVVRKVVVDSTDGGDYQDNPQLMEGVFKAADELTVGYKHLKEEFGKRFSVTQVFWTISTENYIRKQNYDFDGTPIIGWMGSPANFQFVKGIIPVLVEVAKRRKFIFKYICRQNFDNELTGIESQHKQFGDDYYQQLASFDIGISPFLVANLRTKGKIAMKHQEFLLMGTPQVCSPVAISEFVKDGEEVLIAVNQEDWVNHIITLIDNIACRKKLGANSKSLFDHYYTYESQYPKLKEVLTSLSDK